MHPGRTGSRKPTEHDAEVGQRLQSLRVRAGLTQEQLASELGISPQQLSKYETGKNRIPAARLKAAEELLNRIISDRETRSPDRRSTPRLSGMSESRTLYDADGAVAESPAAKWSRLERLLAELREELLGPSE